MFLFGSAENVNQFHLQETVSSGSFVIFLNSAWKLNGDFFDTSLFIHYLSQRACVLSHDPLFTTPRTLQAPLSTGFFRQEYWRELPFPPPGHLPNLGKETAPPALAGGYFFFFFLPVSHLGSPFITVYTDKRNKWHFQYSSWLS